MTARCVTLRQRMTRVAAAARGALGPAFAAVLVLAMPARAQDAIAPEGRVPRGNTAHAAGGGEADAAAAAGAATMSPASGAAALTATQEARVRAIEGELRCPVCRSQSIRQSRSFMAEDMKRRIRTLIVAGRSDAEIRDHFVARYGEWILLTPPKRGFSLAAYIVPLAAVLVGAAVLAFAIPRWRGSRPGPPATDPPPASPYLTRLERELRETE